MSTRLPLVSTAIVLLAVAIMILLGLWQLDRRAEKEQLLARYAQAVTSDAEVPWPRAPDAYAGALYRRARVDCASVDRIEAVAGRSRAGRSGWAQIARCRLAGGGEAAIALGWSAGPAAPRWRGGTVGGTIGPAGHEIRLVASPAQAGLEELAPPDPGAIPNNHLSYAVQWFVFAATALVIYALALRRRGS